MPARTSRASSPSFAAVLAVAAIGLGCAAASAHQQYRVSEFTFTAEQTIANPLAASFSARFTAPDGTWLDVPGFWDGGTTWKLRFTPTQPGQWAYTIRNGPTAGLDHGQGTFEAAPASGDNPLHRHGGILRVSSNGRYLTHTDGTPFFWLGDTWWFCPSDLMPFDASSNPAIDSCFRHVVDRRASQGYTVAQMTFLGSGSSGVSPVTNFHQTQSVDPAYWQNVDRYMDYANGSGIVPAIGLAFHSGMDQLMLSEWQTLWRYAMARYHAHSVTWLICGEYNQNNVAARVDMVLALGQFIKNTDPYRRAMSVHPWWYAGEQCQAWTQPWYDFVMLQGAHEVGAAPKVSFYNGVYANQPVRPFLESECRYEGIRGFTATDVRRAAYRAIQCGSLGYTYGAHGLWYPNQNENDLTFSDWGTPVPWWVALERPGGAQMQHLRAAYESVDWWRLEPLPDAVTTESPLAEARRILAKAAADDTFIVYVPSGVDPALNADLAVVKPGVVYRGRWFDPRTGQSTALSNWLVGTGTVLRLPERPDNQDWLLILESPVVPPDLDRDGDVDVLDFGRFRACLTGAGTAYDPLTLPEPEPGCTLAPDAEGKIAADFDEDADVDQSDFGIFQHCLGFRAGTASDCAP